MAVQWLGLSVLLSVGVGAFDHVLVQTEEGPIQGDVLTLHNGVKVNTFLGVPFAEPPVEHLRWQPPELPESWTEPFIADRLGTACEQLETGMLWLTHPLWVRYNEDCLNLNVFAPNVSGPTKHPPEPSIKSTADAPYPVLVWFHGGSYQLGANIQYPGHFLAGKGTVVVVPNYRLGILGFATSADAAAPGNYGMLDQAFALRWVQRNIAAFGGDPDRVTIFGESAGATSTGLHLVSHLSRGLFHQAILMSGSELALWAINAPEAHPETYTQQVAQKHNCPTDNSWAMMDCLRGIGAGELDRTRFNCTPGFSCLGHVPVVDGVFLTDKPIVLRHANDVAHVPEMIGTTTDEGALFILLGSPSYIARGPDREEYEQVVQDLVSAKLPRVPDQSQEEDIVKAIDWYYSPWPHLDNRDLNRHQIIKLTTDFDYGYTADYQMKQHTRLPQPTYTYAFGYVSNHSIMYDWMGAFHFSDTQFVFGLPFMDLNPDVHNQSGFYNLIDYTEDDVAFSDFFMTLIANFARTGNPTPEPLPSPLDGSDVTWSPFTEDNLQYMYLGNEYVGQQENYRQHQYAFWHSYLNQMILGNDWPFPSTSAFDTETVDPVELLEKTFEYLLFDLLNIEIPADFKLD